MESLARLGRKLRSAGVDQPLLSLDLTAGYRRNQPVLQDFQLDIGRAETVGLVGESGSGKSTLARTILRLERLAGGWSRGRLVFEGRDLMVCSERDLRAVRGREISLVLQSPMTALNPWLRVATHFKEAWRAHAKSSAHSLEAAQREALESVRLPADREFLRRYPGQLSVGQAQRVLIALAILHRPKLLIADEATSSLDAITRASVLELFSELNQRLSMALLFISHDLPAVAQVCQRICVLHQSRIVESGPAADVVGSPSHAYTQQLVAAQPSILWGRVSELEPVQR